MQELKCSMAVPSTLHTYSVATEYIHKWFIDHFSKDYFKTIHIEGKHVFDDFRNFNFSTGLKNEKPALAILPRLSFDFTRDMLDTNMFGLDTLIRTGRLDNAIIKDSTKNLYIGTSLEQLDIKYTFKVRVSTKAQQIDLFKFMSMAFRIGHNYVETVDMDFHIPYAIMAQFALDSGFVVENDKIKDIVGFVKYVNGKSELPVLFKLRTVNQKMEFFLRYRDLDLMISMRDPLSVDDGERQGQLYNNFNIEMEIGLKVPSPKLYLYYSELDQNIPSVETNSYPDPIYNSSFHQVHLTAIPKKNSKGWEQYLVTDWYEDNTTKPVIIELEELFDSIGCKEQIIFNNLTNISSTLFIDFYVYNSDEVVPYTVDWTTMTLHFTGLVKAPTSAIAIYIDTEYLYTSTLAREAIERSKP